MNRATKEVRCSHEAIGQIGRAVLEQLEDHIQNDIQDRAEGSRPPRRE
ncbi:MAG: hypothetical protein WBH47_12750 [Streptosporangiaceae bacterium]